jgi:RNA polymerase sigma factor (sigma-70 family)
MTPPAPQELGQGPGEGESLTSIHVQRAREGDAESLSWLVERFTPLLLAQASYRLGPHLRRLVEPEDLVAEVWAVAVARLPTLRWERERHTPTMLSFLSMTLLNLVNNAARKALRDQAVLRESDMTPEGEESDSPLQRIAADTTIVTEVLRKERARAVMDAIEALSPDDRAILILRGIEQVPNWSVAERLSLKPNTVAHRYRRALARLKAQLPGSVFDELHPDDDEGSDG